MCMSYEPAIEIKWVKVKVISRIDYYNSLLSGVPQYALDRLQRVMNAAARMLCGAGKYSHVSGLTDSQLSLPQGMDKNLKKNLKK